jgi:hypothetical protein
MESVATGNVVTTFQVMSNELSTPILVLCPQDLNRNYATNFTDDFNNSRISYFVVVDANKTARKRCFQATPILQSAAFL